MKKTIKHRQIDIENHAKKLQHHKETFNGKRQKPSLRNNKDICEANNFVLKKTIDLEAERYTTNAKIQYTCI